MVVVMGVGKEGVQDVGGRMSGGVAEGRIHGG
jgi:hypothetical protein